MLCGGAASRWSCCITPTRAANKTSEDFQRLLSAKNIACSMSRRDDCLDNSVVESFFASLKKEPVYRNVCATRDVARADIFDYIEAFHNSRRRHSMLGQVSPKFEWTQAGLA
jgi:putative transposase